MGIFEYFSFLAKEWSSVHDYEPYLGNTMDALNAIRCCLLALWNQSYSALIPGLSQIIETS